MSPSARLHFALRVLLGIGIIIGVLLTVVLVSQSISRVGGTTVNACLTTSDQQVASTGGAGIQPANAFFRRLLSQQVKKCCWPMARA